MVDGYFARAVRQFIAARTEDDVYRALVTWAERSLDCNACRVVAVDGDELVPRASSTNEAIEEADSVPLAHSIAGHTYTTGTASIINDITFTRGASAARDRPAGEPDVEAKNDEPAGSRSDRDPDRSAGASARDRSLLTAPIDEYGVFQATDRTAGAFAQEHLDWIEQLISFASVALDHVHDTGNEPDDDRDSARIPPETLARDVAHDMRTPLIVARGRLQLARRELTEGGRVGDHLDEAAAALERLDQLLDDFVTLPGEGNVVSDLDEVDLGQLASDCWEMVRTRDASLQLEGSLRVEADGRAMRRLLENLFENAVEHGGPEVTVRVGPLDGGGFYVADDGSGISPDVRSRMFERGVSTTDGNVGFGLSIVEQIVDAHGWAIAVMESAQGGARFEITGVTTDDPS